MSDNSMRFTTNTAERMRIDSSGRVGIGTSSFVNANAKLVVSNGTVDIEHYTDTAIGYVGTRSNHPFGLLTNGTPKLYITTAGNVGIGTSTPSEELTIRSSVPKIQLEDSDGTNQYGQFYHSAGSTTILARNNTSDGTIVFQKYDGTTTDETMRIDSSGNLLVGQTTASSNTVGTSLRSDGRNFYCADGNYSGHFNRKTSDGAIVHFAKDDTVVGTVLVSSAVII
jgi:hypothetical protein